MSALGDALRASERASEAMTPPAALEAAYGALSPAERPLLTERLMSEEPAEVLAEVLTRSGFSISASSIRTYRRTLRRNASNV